MSEASYRDIAECGLPFVTPEYSGFTTLVREISSRPQPLGLAPSGDGQGAIPRKNQSLKA
jgi:hypothetical protein